MKTKQDLKPDYLHIWTPVRLMGYFCLIAILLTGLFTPAFGQDTTYERPSWKFGVSGGVNLNYYTGTTQNINSSTFAPTPFGQGNGAGLFLAPVIEYHQPGSVFGFMIQAGFDSRRGVFDQVISACDCPLDLSTELSYITVEPSLRIAPFRSNFYIYTGPRIAFGLDKSFEYEQAQNPQFPSATQVINKSGDFSETNKNLISMQVGAGLDIPLNPTSSKTQYIMSPFVAYHPYLGQEPRSIETWDITTIRAGVTFKFGSGKRVPAKATAPAPTPVTVAPLPTVNFTVNSPKNSTTTVNYVETFPQLNFIFFDLESTSLPTRYVRLSTDQVKSFNENQVGNFSQVSSSGRSTRQMTVYYSSINILGDRMVKNPGTSVTLVGSSDRGMQHARQMSESVKSYLVSTFGISDSRITTEGRSKPVNPSLQSSGSQSLAQLRLEDNRVTIMSSSPELLKEIQTGSHNITSTSQEAPMDSYVTFKADGGSRAFTSWNLEVKDEKGSIRHFGPYTEDVVRLSGKSLLGDNKRGNYTVTMVGAGTNGTTVRREVKTEFMAWEPAKVTHGSRYSVVFGFDNAETNARASKYLMDVVLPAIPDGATVRIQGYTDNIGDSEYNRKLSQRRSEAVREVLQRGLTNARRTGIKFEVMNHGASSSQSQFSNDLPEQRFFNRTVLIDITPSR